MGARGRAPQLGQMYVADFETCDSDDFYKIDGEGREIYMQRVWLAGHRNLKTKEIKWFTSIDDFMNDVLSRGKNVNTEYAIHNLKFDGSFIIPWLFENGYTVTHNKPDSKQFSVLIDDRNNWYSLTIQVTKKRRVTFWDSAKLFPIQLEYLHEIYGTPTKKIHEDEEFYNEKRPEGHIPTEKELQYLFNDLIVLEETLNAHIKLEGLRFKKTQASQAFYSFEQSFPAWRLRFPPLDDETDALIRPAYWGGIAYVNPAYAGKDMYDVVVYDINSSYPHKLADYKMPYGNPIAKRGRGVEPDMSKFWVAEALIEFELKPDKLPCIAAKGIVEARPITDEYWLTDSEGVVRLVFSCIDYYSIRESYDFEIISWEWCIEWAWKVHKELKEYIYKNNAEKVLYKKKASKVDDPQLKSEYLAHSHRAKINNNAFYGKFGEDIIKRGKTPYYENGDIVYRVDRRDILSMRKRKYLPVAIATTAWGRRQLVQMANTLGKEFIYCDTDSVHITKAGAEMVEAMHKEGKIKIDKTELGAWSLEGRFDRARFLRPKCYYEEKYGQHPEVTLAGLPADKHSGARSKKRSCITWENFHIGLKLPPEVTGKLASCRTPTGTKLVPVGFEITEKLLHFLK